jgi:hypothetical protein
MWQDIASATSPQKEFPHIWASHGTNVCGKGFGSVGQNEIPAQCVTKEFVNRERSKDETEIGENGVRQISERAVPMTGFALKKWRSRRISMKNVGKWTLSKKQGSAG